MMQDALSPCVATRSGLGTKYSVRGHHLTGKPSPTLAGICSSCPRTARCVNYCQKSGYGCSGSVAANEPLCERGEVSTQPILTASVLA